jgi:hypothetical protein
MTDSTTPLPRRPGAEDLIARRGSLKAAIVVALLLAATCAVLVWEPWHGPIVLSLWRSHGIDAGDLPAALPIALALAIASARGPAVRARTAPWAGPASAVVLGALLFVGAYKLSGVIRLGALDDVRGVLIIIAAVWFCVALAAGGRPGARQASWWQPLSLFVAGSVVDAALAPSSTLIGPILVALWLARTASHGGAALSMCLLAAVFTALSVWSLAGGLEFMRYDGSIARSAALGLLLVTAGLFAARYGRPPERKDSAIG